MGINRLRGAIAAIQLDYDMLSSDAMVIRPNVNFPSDFGQNVNLNADGDDFTDHQLEMAAYYMDYFGWKSAVIFHSPGIFSFNIVSLFY